MLPAHIVYRLKILTEVLLKLYAFYTLITNIGYLVMVLVLMN